MARTGDKASWAQDARIVERARIVLVVCLSKRPLGEVVRIIMDWLDDVDVEKFCCRYLDDSELSLIRQDVSK
jgi:hypothetical protein